MRTIFNFFLTLTMRHLKYISRNFHQKPKLADHYFDEKLYQERYTIERINAWVDNFRYLLNRFNTTVTSWKGFNFLAFIVNGLKKFYKLKKSK